MRYNKFTTARLFIASLLGIFFMSSLIGCTREDNHIVEPEQFNNPAVSLSVSGSSALTKGTSASEVTIPTSEYIGTDNAGKSLYLNTMRKVWDVEDIDVDTKVTPSTTANHPLRTAGLGVVLYKQNNDSDLPGTWTLLNNTAVALKATYSSSVWVPAEDIKWPNEGKKVHFFVYGPYSDALNSKVTFTATGATQEPRIVDFEVNSNYADQIDLLVANDITSDRTPQTLGLPIGAHRLTLYHALSAIRFKVVDGNTIESIKVKNVYDKATYNMITGEWSGHQNSSNEYVINTPTTHTESFDPGYSYLDDEYTLMMIPSLTSGASPLPNTAVVEIKLEGVADPILANISQHEWLAGHSLTYTIDKSAATPGYTYVIDAVNPTLNHQGGISTNGKITSYKYPTAGGDVESAREAVGWTIEGYYPDATSAANKDVSKRYRNGVNATFINSFTPTTGSGSATGEAVSVVYPPSTPNTPVVDNPGAAYDAAIAAKAKVGTTTPYNLAAYKFADGTTNENTTQITNTANTYIINGPGYYRFPIVMGNGIKYGNVNPTAYQQTGFKDYLDRDISSPYLNGTGDEQPTDAFLAWADWNFIEVVDPSSPTNSQPYANIENWYLKNEGSPSTQTITNGISKIGEYYWVNFHVPTATKQGIASISVRDARGRIMWTWLIWLTDYKLGTGDIECKSLLNTSNAGAGTLTVKLMPRNLGYVERWSETATEYPASTPAYIRLEQSESGNSKVVALNRAAYTDKRYTRGYGPYYQWGRHIPMKPSSTSIDNADPYMGGGFFRHQQTSHIYSGPITMGGAIQQGMSFIVSNSGYYLTTRVSSSLWNAGCSTVYNYNTSTDEKVVKTIYDPCPIGYTIPRRNAFTFAYMGYLHEYSSGQYVTEVSNTNSPNGAYVGNRGRNIFYTAWRANASAAPSATTINIPTLGIRMGASGAMNHYAYTYLATAGGLGWHYSRDGFCTFWGDIIVPGNMHAINYGISVRPQKEE